MRNVLTIAILALTFQVQAGTEIRLRSQTIQTNTLNFTSSKSNNTEWIVQFKNHITEADKKSLVQAGFKVYSYLPEDALVVRGSLTAANSVKQNAKVQAVAPRLFYSTQGACELLLRCHQLCHAQAYASRQTLP